MVPTVRLQECLDHKHFRYLTLLWLSLKRVLCFQPVGQDKIEHTASLTGGSILEPQTHRMGYERTCDVSKIIRRHFQTFD